MRESETVLFVSKLNEQCNAAMTMTVALQNMEVYYQLYGLSVLEFSFMFKF